MIAQSAPPQRRLPLLWLLLLLLLLLRQLHLHPPSVPLSLMLLHPQHLILMWCGGGCSHCLGSDGATGSPQGVFLQAEQKEGPGVEPECNATKEDKLLAKVKTTVEDHDGMHRSVVQAADERSLLSSPSCAEGSLSSLFPSSGCFAEQGGDMAREACGAGAPAAAGSECDASPPCRVS